MRQKSITTVVMGLVMMIVVAVGLLPGGLAAASSNGLGITPRKNYTVQPGAHLSDTLYINNLSPTQPLDVSLRVIDFSAKDETGTPSLQLKGDAPQTPWSLKPFVTIPSSVTVAPGKSSNVPITISIPSGQGGGSYYGAIEYTAGNNTAPQNVTLAASSVSLVFVTVPGQVHESLRLKQFGAFVPTGNDESGSFSSWFFTSPPKVLAYRLQNSGNVAEVPNGSIVLKGTFGKKVKVIEQANPKQQLALIGQTRRFEACIEQGIEKSKTNQGHTQEQIICKPTHLMPGRYTANLAVFYGLNGNNSQEVAGSTTFWYLPVWFLGVVGGVVLLLGGFVYRIRHKSKSHAHKK